MSWNIITDESGDCKCGKNHDEGDILWSGFITKNAAENELETVTQSKHSIELTIEKVDEW